MPKSKHQVPGRVRSTYAFIKAHRDQYSVQVMCRVLEVAVSGYYLWLQQQAVGPHPEFPAAAIHRHAAERCVGDRYHLHPHVAGLALPGGRHGSLFAADRGLGGRALDSPRARAQCCAVGGAATTTPRHVNSTRRHSHLGGVSPEQFEVAHTPRRQGLH